MESLGSWIDIEEFELLARRLLERERQRGAASEVEFDPAAEDRAAAAAVAAEPAAPRPVESVSPARAAAAEGGESATPAPPSAEPAAADDAHGPEPVAATDDDLATSPEPADRALVERVRAKLAALTDDARRAGLLPTTTAPVSGSASEAVQGGIPGAGAATGLAADAFEVPEGGLMARLQAFVEWADARVGSAVALIDQHGDPLVTRAGFEARQQAMTVAVRALNQAAALLHAEPDARGTRMAWLAPDDGAALAVVGGDRDGQLVWAGWIEQRQPGDRAVMRQVREALQRAIGG